MATKSFLKTIDIRKNKQKKNIAHAMAKAEAIAKQKPYEEEPANILSREDVKKYFTKKE